MNLIDRYVKEVAKYLPKDACEDVSKELRANIEDMLPDNYNEEDVYKVLEELGSPMKLANEYNPQKRYLIGPGYFDKYLKVLKMVVGICIAVSIGIETIAYIINTAQTDYVGIIVELFTKVIAGALVGAVQGVFWVTIVFVILERSGVESGYLPFCDSKWTPESLPSSVNQHLKISRGETVFSVICTIVFTALLYFQPQLLAVYNLNDTGITNSVPLFNINRLNVYMFYILTLAVLQLGLFIWKYITERWNMPIIICNAIYNFLLCLLVVVIAKDSSLINTEFVPAIADLTQGTINNIARWVNKGKWIFAVVFIGLCFWDSISNYYRYRLYIRKN